MGFRRFILLGPPGAGKGTQAARLATDLGVPHISTGEILRAAIRDETELGRQARGYSDRGELVPDDLVTGLVIERLAARDAREGYILDGFPRTRPQAETLDRQTAEAAPVVVFFDLPEEEVVARLTGRRVCPSCGASYHLRWMPPEQDGVCDRCGGSLSQRADDSEETVRERLRVYREQTGELVDRYRDRGVLVTLPADGTPDEVYGRLSSIADGAR
jgi:adenylate kinase